VKAGTKTQTVFDHDHYLRLIETRGATIRNTIECLKPLFAFKTALDVGCGLGFFAQILHEAGLDVRAFDGRKENVEEGKRRFPSIKFEQGDIQNREIVQLGTFDFVLCFGLLYHLESPLAAIRNLYALTGKALLLESMCLPEENPWMLLREEPNLEDQSLTDVAFYASEGCLAKMLYRAGFKFVSRLERLPDHDDFRDAPDHVRRRTVLLATSTEITVAGFRLFPEPKAAPDPWHRETGRIDAISNRVKTFAKKPGQQKYLTLARRVQRVIPRLPVPMKLPFGIWWLAEHSALDHELTTNEFESAEIEFVRRFLKPGMMVLDVGAHHGLYTLLASKLVGPTGKVIAFEPSPRERIRLFKHLKFNRARNVRVESCALGETNGMADLFLSDDVNDWCNSLREPAGAALKAVQVDVKRLDEIISQQQLNKIDFVKMDIEGGELNALKGAKHMLATREHRPVILIEVQDKRSEAWGHRGANVIRMLEEAGYEWAEILQDGALQPLDTSAEQYDGNYVAIPSEKRDEVFAQFAEKEKQ